MPWMNLQNASEQDLSAMHAYLASLPPVRNAVPAARVPGAVIDELGKLNTQRASD